MTVPGIYLHYKGGLYRVLFTAKMSSNGFARENLVVYVSLEKGSINVRHETEFHEPIDIDPTLRVPRFRMLKTDHEID